MPPSRTRASSNSPSVIGDNSPIAKDWRWVVSRAVERAGNQSVLAAHLGTKEQNVRRWINNEDDPSPTHNDQMRYVDAMWQRDSVLARALLTDILESLSCGNVQLAPAAHPTREVAAAHVRSEVEKFLTGPFAGGAG